MRQVRIQAKIHAKSSVSPQLFRDQRQPLNVPRQMMQRVRRGKNDALARRKRQADQSISRDF
jgi:hypothetical protein